MSSGPRAVVLAFVGAVAVAPPAVAQQIVVRGGYGAPPAAEALLAKIARGSQIPVKAGEDPLAVARRICGRATATYQGLLRAANPGAALTPTDTPRTLSFPACFIMDPDQKTATRLGSESLQDFAVRVIGTGGPQTLKQLQARNVAVSLAPTGRASTVAIPFSSAPAVYQLKPGAAPDAATAAKAIVQTFDHPVEAAAVAKPQPGDLRPMSGIIEHVATACDLSRKALPDSAWPFDIDQLLRALDRNRLARVAKGMPPAHSVVVAVGDNGFDRLLTPDFPDSVLAISGGETPKNYIDDDLNGYVDDVTGVTVFSDDPPLPAPLGGLPDRQHGTLIASLAIGGPDYRAKVADGLAERVKLLPISMIERRVEMGPPNIVRYGYPSRGLREALHYAQDQGAQILNLSVGTPLVVSDFEELAAQSSTLVIVAAAGNEATDFNFVQLYPASYGGEGARLPGRVITVGASDRRGCLADFSGRGTTTVDIAAPGVRISALGLNGARETDDGTSQATGLVSFAVALLKSEGLVAPLAIKDRLFATADRNSDLAQYVLSGGTLNITKAISLHHDIWEKNDGNVVWGQLAAPPKIADLCPQAGDAAKGKVLRVAWQGGSKPLSVLWRAQGGPRKELACKPADTLDHLDFIDESGAATAIKLTEIASLVPH
jgi:hypothetical protein